MNSDQEKVLEYMKSLKNAPMTAVRKTCELQSPVTNEVRMMNKLEEGEVLTQYVVWWNETRRNAQLVLDYLMRDKDATPVQALGKLTNAIYPESDAYVFDALDDMTVREEIEMIQTFLTMKMSDL